jgi:geranylgeranyl pyrophosphate synthase
VSARPRGGGAAPADLGARIVRCQERIERVLDEALTLRDPGTARLGEAMRYSVLGAGKRLRPILVYLTGESLGAAPELLDAPAAAVELIHVYSLVHDDLPAMDDDDLRRGRPTCHRAFDEGTAVLVGDALQALAFAVLANAPPSAAGTLARLQMIRVLARATGTGGMAGGQAIDLAAVGRRLSVAEIEDMHRRKTGALIECSVLLGALAAGITEGARFAALQRFGEHVGLAFQIQDDILDVEGDPRLLGKATGADAAHAKPTYPSTAGLLAARERARALRDAAVAALQPLGAGAQTLVQLADFVINRAS